MTSVVMNFMRIISTRHDPVMCKYNTATYVDTIRNKQKIKANDKQRHVPM